MQNMPVPIYGDGAQIRDWIFVQDHCRGIDTVFHKGKAGETYNIGARYELTNLELVEKIAEIMTRQNGVESYKELIKFVKDRPGHDCRYAIDPSKIEQDLGWKTEFSFETALEKTVGWYLDNSRWLESSLDEEFQKYYKRQYSED